MSDDALETTLCTNCKRDILSTNFVIHTIHCQRNIYLCPKCDEPVIRGQQAEHDESYHKSTFCTSCHIQLEKCKLKEHLSDECPKRKVKCQICEIVIDYSEISEHENYCGARTEKCQECGEFVMLKYKQLHLDSNHTFIKLLDEPGPSPSWQNGKRILGNFLSDANSGNFKSQSGQKKKSVHNRTRNSFSEHYEKNHNEAVGSDSNEKNSFLPSSETESHKTKKTMPTLPKETALGAVKKTITTSYSPSYVPNKIFDNFEGDKLKNKDKAINNVLKKSLNTDKDTMLELDRLLAQQLSESLDEETLLKEKQEPAIDETADLLLALQISDSLESQEELLKKKQKTVVDETADLFLALKINEELNSKEDTSNDHLIAKQLAEESGKSNKFLNTSNPFVDAIEKDFGDRETSLKNIFQKQNDTKTVRKPELVRFSDDSDDDLSLLAYADKGKKKNEEQNLRLPCEFCEKMIPSTYLNTHQQGCRDIYRKNDIFGKFNSSFKEEKVECKLCGGLFPISRLDEHETFCIKAVKFLDESPRRSSRLEKMTNASSNKKVSNLKHNSHTHNGIETSAPELRGMPNRSNHSDSPKNNNDRQKNLKKNTNPAESFGAVPRAPQPSRKNRRAPSPPKM